MKIKLLFAGILMSGISFGQLTQANEAAIGTTKSMYLLDSNLTNYSNVTGNNVTWDYSLITLANTVNTTKTMKMIAPSSHSEGVNYLSASKALEIDGLMTTFLGSTSSNKLSKGYVFDEPSVGTIKVVYSTDDQILATYPFAVNNSVADNFAGNIELTYMGMPQTMAAVGSSVAHIDGKGTLKVGSQTLNDVLRYKINDTVNGNLNIFGQTITMQIFRTQYEYYTSSYGLPTFIHYTMKLEIPVMNVSQEFSVVLSENGPAVVSTESIEALNMKVYPNPTQNYLTVEGEYKSFEILDQTGRVVTASENVEKIDVSDLKTGVYTINIKTDSFNKALQFVKQ